MNKKLTMTKLETIAEVAEEKLYAIAPDFRPGAMSPKQRATMITMCQIEGSVPNGYPVVPLRELRDDPSIHRLLDMMETCRPGGGPDEEAFIEDYLADFKPYRDDYGNHIVEVPIPEGHPRIMWSVHTDTVHRHGGRQKVEVTEGVAWTSDGSCLGSDDTVGVWLAQEMITQGVPGVYVFHRDEEKGGRGSMWLAREASEFVGSFDAAIALDRAGYRDVITHQSGGRCCSDEFAKSLADLLGGGFKPCDGGVFTDTANYVDLIGECTNLSVGYFRQHGVMEHTNLGFASRLRDALLAADWSKLVLKRQPGEVDEMDWSRWPRYDEPRPKGPAGAFGDKTHYEKLDAMEEFIREFPWVVAEYLVELGVEPEDLDLYEPGDLTVGGK